MIPVIKKILYATDLSKNSAHALRYALYLARQDKGQIYIIHIIEEVPPHIQAFLGGYVDTRYIDECTAGAIDQIKKRLEVFYARELKDESDLAGRVTSIEVYQGYPADEILGKADELECDAIVMGTHGKGLSRAFLGSVAEKVLRRSTKPVFVIPLPRGDTDVTFKNL